jgi:integrase
MARDPDEWPILREQVYPSGKKAWMVDCGTVRINGKVKRERYFYELKKDAESKRDLLRVQRKNEGQAAFELEPSQRDDAKKALEILSPHGATLRQAAQFYVEHLDVISNRMPVSDVVAQLLEAKAQDGRSEAYIDDIKVRLNAFATAFYGRLIHEIRPAELETYLRSLTVGAISRNNVKRLLGVLFSFAVKRRYTLKNPAAETDRATITQDKPGILTLPEACALVKAAKPEILPAIAIGLFAGLRPEAEIWRLTWSQIDLKERLIDVAKSKNLASHRFVKISDNLAEWLKPYADKSGAVSSTERQYFREIAAARNQAAEELDQAEVDTSNLREWPSDCMRHTYASYHFGAFKNAHETAEQLGHGGNLTIFYRNYGKY